MCVVLARMMLSLLTLRGRGEDKYKDDNHLKTISQQHNRIKHHTRRRERTTRASTGRLHSTEYRAAANGAECIGVVFYPNPPGPGGEDKDEDK